MTGQHDMDEPLITAPIEETVYVQTAQRHAELNMTFG